MKTLTRAELRKLVVQHATDLDASAAANPFASVEWTLHFIDQVARDDWLFWIAGEVEASAGWMLLYSEPSRPSELRALTNYYASLYSPLVGRHDSSASEVAVRTLGSASKPVATVDLAPIALGSVETIQHAFSAAGWLTRRYSCFGNWYLPCAGLSFEQYMAARPSQLINTWRRKAKKFKPGTAEARLQLVTAPADVDVAMQAYGAVYAQSWKTAEPYPTFVSDWAAVCAERGWLRLGIAWLGDTPIAAQFWFTMNRRAYIFKLAYDDAHSNWSAGTVLSAFLFQHSLDVDHVVEIDYLTGDDAYKQSWMTERRERVGLIACNPRTWRGLSRGVYEWAGELRQRWQTAPKVREPAVVAEQEIAA